MRAVVGREEGPGIPTLLEYLGQLTGQQVYLWLSPQASPNIRWRVWTGAPVGSGGGELGRGETPYAALREAFDGLVQQVFTREPDPVAEAQRATDEGTRF